MPPLFYLDPLSSSLVRILAVTGLAMILPYVVKPERTSHRVALYAGVFFFGLRYLWWRATQTLMPPGLTLDFVASWGFFALELITVLGTLSASVIMMRTRDRHREADAHRGWWRPGPEPRVAILIATYNEELEVLERTIVGALALGHANKQVIVLDDGRRDWLRDYCEAHAVRYLRRGDNKHAKAGNLNNALATLAQDAEPPDYVAVLDADFVPHQRFLSRTLALFHDPSVGLVQTPQHFFNPDPVQHNLGLSGSFPDEQRFFFDHMQPARDAWGIALCCGTSSVIRWQALAEVGGFPTFSVTEDFLLTLVLREKGWRTVYLNEPLTEGLAPEGLKEYVTQRGRWCLGTMQIARSRFGPFGRSALGLADRWSILDATFYWTTTFVFRLAALIFPLFYWFGNVIVVNAALPDVIDFFGCYFVWLLMTYNLLCRNIMVPILNDVQQILGAIPIARSAFVGLLSGANHAFKVTAKGGERGRVVVQWQMMRPFLILFLLNLTGLLIGIFSDRFAFNDAGEGKATLLFWTLYNLVVLGLTIVTCIELPRTEIHVADTPERAVVTVDGTPRRLWIVGLTLDMVRVRGHSFAEQARGYIRLPDVGDVACYVVAATPDGARLKLLPDEAQRKQLFLRFYTQGGSPGVLRVRRSAVLRDIFDRFGIGQHEG